MSLRVSPNPSPNPSQYPSQHPDMVERFRRQPWLLAPLGVALACVVIMATIPATRWAELFQSSMRTELNGGAIIETTIRGAALWRVMLGVVAAALVLLPLLLAARCRGTPRGRPAAESATGRRELLALLGITVVAILLRSLRVSESLWYDELAVLFDYQAYGPGAIVGNYFVSSNHIAHTLLGWVSLELLGIDELSLRLPALLFSVASVPAVFGLASRAGLGSRVALIAAAGTAVMPVSVLEGVEARGYSMMIFFAATSTWALLAAWDEDRPDLWFLYSVLAALGVWSHLMTVFIVIGHGLWIIARAAAARDGERGLHGVIAIMLAAIVTLTLYAPVLPDIIALRDDFRALDGDEPSVFGIEGLHAVLQMGGSWYLWATVPGMALVMLGVLRCRRDGPLAWTLAATWLGAPICVLLLLALDSWLYSRFLLFALPGAAVAAAAGLDAIARRHRMAAVAAGLTVAVLFAADLARRPPKQPLRDAVAYVAANQRPGDRVGSIGIVAPAVAFYAVDAGLDHQSSGPYGAALERMLARHDPSWVIVLYPRSVAPDRFALLDRSGFKRIREFDGWVDWNNGNVEVWSRSR